MLENGLRNSSVSSWLEIVPRLISRLHHPEPYVQNSITELLERIAQRKPDEVVFAVVVALTKADHQIEAGLRYFDANEHSRTLSSTTMSKQQATLQRIRNNLSPIVVKDVEIVLHELRRKTLPWDELELGSLTKHYWRKLVKAPSSARCRRTSQRLLYSETCCSYKAALLSFPFFLHGEKFERDKFEERNLEISFGPQVRGAAHAACLVNGRAR